ncbi:MAG TPA: heme lyase CcmF/NrfE family subunit [Nitrospiria bacterium]
MLVEIGHFAVVISFVLSVIGIIAPIVGLKTRRPEWVRVGRQTITINFFLLSIGMAVLIYSYLQDDFSVNYIMATSNSKLPLFYKVAALWGGHEGSLLLWVWILTTYSTIAVWLHWRTQPAVMPYLISVQSVVICGFLAMIVFLSSPFERVFPVPTDGRDLNPLLQDPAMVVHPPMLYLGYVGFSIPFAFAMAALFSGRLGEEWIKVTQRWTLLAWISLTAGIMMGGYWAYYELGWGGYWGWDPVENASFMPWLVGTAFLHSVMVQEKRKMFRVWNLFLIILTFLLSLIGTFLVRSGVLSSVHTFATDPGRGFYILIFLGIMMVMGFGTLIFRSNRLKSTVTLESVVSKESAFLFNNLFFLVATATVFLGTLYPLIMETLTTTKVSVGAPYYNAVFMPVALGLILLMGIAPSIAWRKASTENLKKNFVFPLIIAVAATILAWVFGIRTVFGIAGAFIVSFAAVTIAMDFGKIAVLWSKRKKTNYLTGLFKGVRNNQRRYAGLVTHIGVLVTVIGIIASTVYQQEKVLPMHVGEEFTLGPYMIRMVGLETVEGPNWTAQQGVFDLYREGAFLTQLKPQKRIYTESQTPTTETAIFATRLGHVFITMPEVVPGGGTVRALINPLVLLVWGGGIILGIGVLMNVFRPKKKEA